MLYSKDIYVTFLLNNNIITHYIIIGGTGFLGQNIVKYLLQKTNKVIVIGRRAYYKKLANEIYYNSISSAAESLKENTDENYVVIDVAYSSVPKTSFDDPVKDFSENLYNIIANLEFAAMLKVSKYIYTSSGGTIYGDSDKNAITETDANFPLAPYGITKMACERYVNMYHKIHGLNTCIIRPSNVYGPGQMPVRGQGFIATVLGLAYSGKPITLFGDGSYIRDNVYIDDFCEAVNDVVLFGESGEIYNIGDGKGLSLNDTLKIIENVLIVDNINLDVQKTEARPFDVKMNVLSNAKLNQLNGWQPKTELANGIQQTAQWIKRYMQEQA